MKVTFLFLVLLSQVAVGQITISPLNNEFGKKAKGEFSLRNESYAPLSVSIEIASADFANGQLAMAALKSTVHARLSEYSAKIPSHQTRTIAYSISCDVMPCSVVFLSTVVVGHTNEGMAIALRLGHVVYVCEQAKNCRTSFVKDRK